MAKLHVRFMVGGHARGIEHEQLYRFEFPERPGRAAAIPARPSARAGTSACSTTAITARTTAACWRVSRCRRPSARTSWITSTSCTIRTRRRRRIRRTGCFLGRLTDLLRQAREAIANSAEMRRRDVRPPCSHLHVQRMPEQRPVVDESVELAVLAARIHSRRQIGDEACIELPAAELIAEIARVRADHERAEPQGDGLFRELAPIALPQRQARLSGPPSRTRAPPSHGAPADRCRRISRLR